LYSLELQSLGVPRNDQTIRTVL